MKYKFQLDKSICRVEIANNSTFHSETNIKINKENLNLLIGEHNEEEIKSFFIDNKLYQIEIVRDNEGYPSGIYVNGEYFSASLLKIDSLFYYKHKPISSQKSGIVKSFIPGNIKKIFYDINDKVNEGDIILIHEAMKMENEIRAPKSGIIKKINVNEGENILANRILFEIE
jgi:pyruvate carboxylase subunit B